MKEITKEWVKKAEQDYKIAIRESKAKPIYPYAVCFHSQQCIEKYMKAVLQENNISFGKIHDLEMLLKDCKEFIPALESFREELIWLTTFAVEIRYPGFDAKREDANKAAESIVKLKKLFRNYLKRL